MAAGKTAWLVIRRSWVHIPEVLARIKASDALSRKIYAYSPFSTLRLVKYLSMAYFMLIATVGSSNVAQLSIFMENL